MPNQILPSQNQSIKTLLNDDFVQSCYPALLNFATNQLNDGTLAEDVVQEAFISAIKHKDRFDGKSAFKTWVFAILKNKLTDTLRAKQKYNATYQSSDELMLTTLFDESGSWHQDSAIGAFGDDWLYASDDSYEFWQVLQVCLTELPAEQARVFMMKEYIGFDTDEICQECGISNQNFYVLMYRARLKLQYCLKLNWFDD